MDLVGQMYRLSACFDTPSEYKGLPYDYFPEDAVTYGSSICSFGLSYNDHNYGMPTGLTPPIMAPHLMDPVVKPKKTVSNLLINAGRVDCMTTESGVKSATSPASSTTTTYRSSDSTPRKAYLDENDYPVYVMPEIKVVEVPASLCVSASEYSDASSDSSDDAAVNPEFLFYLRSLASRHPSIERYITKTRGRYDLCPLSPKSSVSEKKQDGDFVVDCVCEYNYDDRRLVQCETCGIRQHIDCMYVNPREVVNFLKHKCHNCSDIVVDIVRAKSIQNSRKNWFLTKKYSAKWHQRSKNTSSEHNKLDDNSKCQDTKGELLVSDSGHTAPNSNTNRVNKRKQDLKAYGVAEVEKSVTEEPVESVEPIVEQKQSHSSEVVAEPVPKTSVEDTEEADDDPNMVLSDMYAHCEGIDEVKPMSAGTFASIGEDYAERLALLNRRPQVFKKDYKEATKSLYSDKLLAKIEEMQENEEERKLLMNPFEGLDHGPEFLERNPRCRIVLFDGCTIGLEASVRLQTGSIVCALIGRIMLMEEYVKHTNPTVEHKPFLFLYHNFLNYGLVIDTSVYGNIVRYLRRSCDPNVKLEHTFMSGNLYIVVRTTSDISQGVELTIPFDLPFEICQYPVQCACGKVRCPAVRHRRKHYRNRIITTSINCEQVIEDKLRELSQPLTSAPETYTVPAKKPSLMHRFPYQGRPMSDLLCDQMDVKPPRPTKQRLSQPRSDRTPTITKQSIKIEEMEPSPLDEQPHLVSPSKQISSDLSGSAILSTKRRPKPILHPDFEMDMSSHVLERGWSSQTPVLQKTKSEPSLKRTNASSVCATQKEDAALRTTITTRGQRQARPTPSGEKVEPFLIEELGTRRSHRVRK